jgi:hypothetical protein
MPIIKYNKFIRKTQRQATKQATGNQKGGSRISAKKNNSLFPSLEGLPILFPDVPNVDLVYKYPAFNMINNPESRKVIKETFKFGGQLILDLEFMNDFNRLSTNDTSLNITMKLQDFNRNLLQILHLWTFKMPIFFTYNF